VPLVLGLRAAERTHDLRAGSILRPLELSEKHPIGAAAALEVLVAAGWSERHGGHHTLTALGARGVKRGPGPFGIIETYHPYMAAGARILLEGRQRVWVSRGENVGALSPADLVRRLERLPGFRNVVIHAYVTLDLDRVLEALDGLAPIEEFLQIVTGLETEQDAS